jgi:hypothetical protein
VFAHVLQHGAQVFEVEQEQALVVCNLEDHVEHASLRVVQVEHAAQQQRPHVGDGGAHGVARLAKHIPQRSGAADGLRGGQAAFLDGGCKLGGNVARLADACQVAFDVGHKDGHADFGEAFSQRL